MNKMLLTICTPTYNRAYILPQLYETLCKQKGVYENFEWVIIDDDSDDNTSDLIEKWISETNRFNIKYIKQEHGGKHRALNKAFDLAEGEYIFIVDSDDMLTDNAVSLIYTWLNSIRNNNNFAGVAGLRISKSGKPWGGKVNYKETYVDATNFERRKYNLLGDKAEIYKTSILRKHKFPEIPNEYFMTEDYCWMQIAALGYKIRWYNEPIYICEYLDDGLTNTGANSIKGHKDNYIGYCLYIKKCLQLKPFTEKMIHFREYIKTAKILNKSLNDIINDIDMSFYTYFLMYIFGIPSAYLIRKLRNRI